MGYEKHLQIGRKNYYYDEETGKILSLEKNSFGDVITKVYLNTNDKDALEKVWAQFHDIYHYGRKSKVEELERALRSY